MVTARADCVANGGTGTEMTTPVALLGPAFVTTVIKIEPTRPLPELHIAMPMPALGTGDAAGTRAGTVTDSASGALFGTSIIVDAGTPRDGVPWMSFCPGGDEHFAWTSEATVRFELLQRRGNLLPDGVLLRFRQAREHLVERAERFALEAHALRGRGQAHGYINGMQFDIAEARRRQCLLQHTGATEAEGARLTGRGRGEVRRLRTMPTGIEKKRTVIRGA